MTRIKEVRTSEENTKLVEKMIRNVNNISFYLFPQLGAMVLGHFQCPTSLPAKWFQK